MADLNKIILNDTEYNIIASNESSFDSAVSILPVDVGGDTINLFNGDGFYAYNPFGNGPVNRSLRFYNANKESLPVFDENDEPVGRPDLDNLLSIQPNDILYFSGATFTIKRFLNYDDIEPDVSRNNLQYHLNEVPSYIRYNGRLTYNVVSESELEEGLYWVTYDDEKYLNFFDQIHANESQKNIDGLTVTDDFGRRVKAEMVRQINKARHGIRLCTFNVARYGQSHWYKIKEAMEDCVPDICGMQEVSNPLTGKIFSDYFTDGWAFANASDNGDARPINERMLLTRDGYAIDSTIEVFFENQSPSGDYRYVAKSVVSLPRYMDKRGSENLKLSVYNTQLEVISASVAQAQAREIVAMVQNDENPFIIIMGDTNDFTVDKKVWKIFEDAGFTTVVDTNTSTVAGTYDFNCIDNFFLSERISAIDYDVIWAQNYPWRSTSGYQATLSDHDIVIADVVFDYSDIRCVNYHLTNVTATATNNRTWLSDTETLTITLTPASGYTLGTITVKDCMLDNPEAITISGNTITLDGSKLIGDVLITCSGVAT